MSDENDEVQNQITHLCETMEINQDMIRYVWVSGSEFIGEAFSMEFDDLDIDEDASLEIIPDNETTYFHPMKINVDVFIDEGGHLESNKYFSDLNPYTPNPYSTFKNYDILTQTPIYPDLMLEYLKVVYNSYFDPETDISEAVKITVPVKKNNVLIFSDYHKKKKR